MGATDSWSIEQFGQNPHSSQLTYLPTRRVPLQTTQPLGWVSKRSDFLRTKDGTRSENSGLGNVSTINFLTCIARRLHSVPTVGKFGGETRRRVW